MDKEVMNESQILMVIECQVYVSMQEKRRNLENFAEYVSKKYFPNADMILKQYCLVYMNSLWDAQYTLKDMKKYIKHLNNLNENEEQ